MKTLVYIILINIIITNFLSSCGNRKMSKEEIRYIVNKLEQQDLIIFNNWSITKREPNQNSSFLFSYFYEHNDSSKLYYRNDGSLIEDSKYSEKRFICRKQKNDTLLVTKLKSNIDFIQRTNAIDSSLQYANTAIDSIAKSFFNMGIDGIISYPWGQATRFNINEDISLYYFFDTTVIDKYKKEIPIIKPINKKWYYLFLTEELNFPTD
ncbi:MAG: hypothetical protein IPO21_00300 [Bacteroidales bacterium]|nr:hypothetical protein [Bacteroidales bacterium]